MPNRTGTRGAARTIGKKGAGLVKRLTKSAALAAIVFLAASAFGASAATDGPPPTPAKPVTETIFGTTINDPYRWLENLSDPTVRDWFQAQNAYTSKVLATLDPARERLRARITALSQSSERLAGLDREGGSYFYQKRPASAANFRLYVRPVDGGAERMLFNPETYGDGKTHWSLGAFAASPDGRYVAIFIFPGGSEVGIINVLDAATGKPLGDSINRILYGSIAWRPDGQSFFYNRLQVMKPGMAENEREQNEHTFLHVLGQSAERDVEFLGHGVSARVPMTASDQASISETPASPYAVAFVYGESITDVAVYVAPTQSVTGPNAPWRRIADFSDHVSGAAQRGSQLYLLEHKRSSRFAVDVMDLDRPGAAQPFIDPSNAVIRDFTLAKDGLYTHDLDGGVYHLRRKGYAPGAATETVALPFLGSVDGVNSDPRYTGIQFELENWTQPPAWYHAVAPSSVVDLNLVAKPAVSFDDYTAEEVQAKGADGTMIPLSIVHRKGIALDGSHPLLLSGYGSYGIVEDATFSPRSLALLERGAVVATAHVRGGGEYGEDWHAGGQKGNKKNTWLDFIACAQYLIDHKYTSHEHIAAEGGSAGGITVGRAITTDPKLFAAAIIDVGWENVTRIAQERNGPANFPSSVRRRPRKASAGSMTWIHTCTCRMGPRIRPFCSRPVSTTGASRPGIPRR